MNNQNSKMQAIEKDLFKSNENPFFRRFIAAALALCIILLMCGCNPVTIETEEDIEEIDTEETSSIIISSKTTTASQKKTTTATSNKSSTNNKSNTNKSITNKALSGNNSNGTKTTVGNYKIYYFDGVGVAYDGEGCVRAGLSNDKLFIFEQTSFKLVYEYFSFSQSNDKIKSYSSSNTSVITVSNDGIVKSLKPGTATITVASASGAICKITAKVFKSYRSSSSPKLTTALPYIINDSYGKYSLNSCNIKLREELYGDDISNILPYIMCELDIKGTKTYDYSGNDYASQPYLYLITRQNGKNIGSELLTTNNSIVTGDSFDLHFECELVSMYEYTFEFAQ